MVLYVTSMVSLCLPHSLEDKALSALMLCFALSAAFFRCSAYVSFLSNVNSRIFWISDCWNFNSVDGEV